VLAARAWGKPIVDGVWMDVKNLEGFRKSCEQGKRLGFDGKSLIHPNSIDICNEVFSPTEKV